MAVILSEISFLISQQQWLQASIRFWNQVVALPAGDLYRDLVFDSLQEAVMPGPLNEGFVKGLHDESACMSNAHNSESLLLIWEYCLSVLR